MNIFASSKKSISIYFLAWISVALFYFYQYILRVSPGIMVVELRQVFKLTAQEFSSLGSIYLFSYSLLQVPLGFILDCIGVKRVILFSVLLCILGTCTFAFAHDVWMLQVGRFLIGLGSAPAFICALKLIHDHLPEKYSGLFMGITLSIGTFGALLSGKCLIGILDNHGWQNTLLLCATLGGFIFWLIFFIIPHTTKNTHKTPNTLSHFKEGITAIFKRKDILIYSIIAISVYTPLCVLADLWGTAFLMKKFSLPRALAAQLSLYLYGGLTIGSLLLPWLSVRFKILREVIQLCAIGLIVALSALLYVEGMSLWQVSALLCSIGLFCGAEMICFSGAAQLSPLSHSGLTLGVVNTLNMLGGAVIQQIIGWYLDKQWKGVYNVDGSRFYGSTELTIAFSLLIGIIFVCCLLTIFLSKNKISQQKDRVKSNIKKPLLMATE